MAKYYIEESDSGGFGLRKDRRYLGDQQSLDSSKKAAAEQMVEGDVLYHVAPDGYRTRLSRSPGWRR